MAHDIVVLAYRILVTGCGGNPGATAAWKPDVVAWREHPEPDALFDNLTGTGVHRRRTSTALSGWPTPPLILGVSGKRDTSPSWKAR